MQLKFKSLKLIIAIMSSSHIMTTYSTCDIIPGEGTINEKRRLYRVKTRAESNEVHFSPRKVLSHLLHTLVGLDRYPNYLGRWNFNLDDIDELESALEEQLDTIRQQKRSLIDKNKALRGIIRQVEKERIEVDKSLLVMPSSWEEVEHEVLHPIIAKAIFKSKQFRNVLTRPSIRSVLDGKVRVKLDNCQLQALIDEELEDIFSFPLLSSNFCHRIKMASKAIIKHDLATKDPKLIGSSKSSIDLDSIGASWINNLLFHLVMRPISKELFAPTEKFDDLDWRQGYIAAYSDHSSERSISQRNRLDPHTDDSEVTLNIGLGDEEFEGGNLKFWGLRGKNLEFVGELHPQIGHAVMHSGRQFHEVTKVDKGDRFAYIIWTRSWHSLRHITCPCCWLNNRQEDSSQCICHPVWN